MLWKSFYLSEQKNKTKQKHFANIVNFKSPNNSIGLINCISIFTLYCTILQPYYHLPHLQPPHSSVSHVESVTSCQLCYVPKVR